MEFLGTTTKYLAAAEKPPSTIPLSPFRARKGEEFIAEGHPQTPGKGAWPLCTPHVGDFQTFRPTLCAKPIPFPGRGKKDLWGTPLRLRSGTGPQTPSKGAWPSAHPIIQQLARSKAAVGVFGMGTPAPPKNRSPRQYRLRWRTDPSGSRYLFRDPDASGRSG